MECASVREQNGETQVISLITENDDPVIKDVINVNAHVKIKPWIVHWKIKGADVTLKCR